VLASYSNFYGKEASNKEMMLVVCAEKMETIV
jgi:hypothetical protein